MKIVKLTCPECGHKWTWGFWEWVLKTPFHMFNFHAMRDARKTKCPKCGKTSWITRGID